MTADALTPDETRAMLLHVARAMVDREDELNDADRAVGDGDHGLAVARGFGAVRLDLERQELEAVDDLFRAVGRTLLATMGGASGVLFATLFIEGATNLPEPDRFGSAALAQLLADGRAAVERRGGARVGQKTIVDALAPAADAAAELRSRPLKASLPAAAEAARKGAERTKTMIAATGKARTLGDRSLGYVDPGAMSIALILHGMADYVLTAS